MLLTVEPDGAVPIYQQIRDRIVEAIASGQQPAGSALPHREQELRHPPSGRPGPDQPEVRRGDPPRRGQRTAERRLARDWTGRLATLLAEAAAQGMGPEEIARHCRAGSLTAVLAVLPAGATAGAVAGG
jgi:GntR family transcriptional regulator